VVDAAGQRPEGRTVADDQASNRGIANGGEARELGDSGRNGDWEQLPRDESEHDQRAAHSDHASIPAGATRGFWHPAEWLPCTDGVSRPVEPGTQPLAHGVPARVGQLRAYGNAINTEVAATFIESALDAIGGAA
jgi:DNA (cytosine-5)-methyltransferase 1